MGLGNCGPWIGCRSEGCQGTWPCPHGAGSGLDKEVLIPETSEMARGRLATPAASLWRERGVSQ